MLTDQQISARRFFIGSSEAAAACGVSPYKSRLQLWLEKTGRAARANLSDDPRVHFGNVLEPIVAQEYARRHPELAPLERNRDTVYDGIRAATIDYRINGKILECKTAGAWTAHLWRDAVPADYRIQVEHQLMTLQERDAVLAVLIGGNDFREYVIRANGALQELIHGKQSEFMAYLDTDTPPPVESAADAAALFPDAGREQRIRLHADAELIADVERYKLVATRRANADKELSDITDRIAVRMRETTDLYADGEVIARYSAPLEDRVDWRSVAGELAQHVARAVWDRTVVKHRAPAKRRLIIDRDR